MPVFDYAIVGGGILGLGTAMCLAEREPSARIVLLEKEPALALHQTGRNSGVIHSGIYYKPGSFKARFARAGSRSIVAFCEQHGIPFEVCGKLIVAGSEAEIPLLERLFQRGLDNGLEVVKLSGEAARQIEPHVRCVAAIHVKSTGITSFRAVAAKYAELFQTRGGTIQFGASVRRLRQSVSSCVLETTAGDFETRFLINCAGLHSDRLARMDGRDPGARIVPFRGEYFELLPERRHLVKTLIYPVPNPQFPFLGVHFTRMIDGSVHAGPNAVLAFRREGYFKSNISLRDTWETLTYGGFWKLALRHAGEGLKEIQRSFSKVAFVRSLQRLIPEIQADDLVPCAAGVRAQALAQDGTLVDDFLILTGPRAIHVCNAPSPAATASLEIARHIVNHVPERLGPRTVPSGGAIPSNSL